VSLGLQRFTLGHIALGAYQTLKRIILVASDLPEDENAALAESLAKPVVEHLRKAEAGAGLEEKVGRLNVGQTKVHPTSSEESFMSSMTTP
jgi:hypothetical protein